MKIKDYLNQASDAPAKSGSSGIETDWLQLCEFKLRGKHLQMVEKRIIGGRHEKDSVTIPAVPGVYTVECRGIAFEGDRRVSRMRVLPKGASASLGGALGKIGVDLGGIAITDIDVLAPSVEENEDEYEGWIDDALFGDDDGPVGVLHWEKGETHVPYTDGGFGDGTYTVYQLMSSGKAIGLEVEFIAPDTKYPF